jgi:hypothetical protein
MSDAASILARKREALGWRLPPAFLSTNSHADTLGVNDGWTDLADNYRLDWQYEAALDGNIALTGWTIFLEARNSQLVWRLAPLNMTPLAPSRNP